MEIEYKEFESVLIPKIVRNKVFVVCQFKEDKQEETTILLNVNQLKELASYIEKSSKTKKSSNNDFKAHKSSPKVCPNCDTQMEYKKGNVQYYYQCPKCNRYIADKPILKS